ncbi:MAG: fatty acid desaturase family protein [Gammaproteobacteria bacterium]|nr:fatty acid desaturase family protein [Gammaproteobacteria bacterium]
MFNAPAASELLTPAQLEQVRARSDAWGAWLVCHAWALIVGSAALAVAWPNPLTWLLAIAVIGNRQLGLLILMHDAAHGALFRTPALNRWVAQLACAWPTFADTAVYRTYHLRHHRHTQLAEDPDIILTGYYPITRASLRRKLLRDLLGRTGFSQRRAQLVQALGRPEWPAARRLRHFARQLGPQLAVNAMLLALAAATGHAWAYAVFWLLPLLTWQQLVLRVRNIAEHACVRGPDDAFGNARTTLANPLERLTFAPYWVNYHLEHHLVMWVPCHRLPLLRRFLVENGYGARIETEPGYLAVLRKVTVDRPDDAGGRRQRAQGTFSQGFESTA